MIPMTSLGVLQPQLLDTTSKRYPTYGSNASDDFLNQLNALLSAYSQDKPAGFSSLSSAKSDSYASLPSDEELKKDLMTALTNIGNQWSMQHMDNIGDPEGLARAIESGGASLSPPYGSFMPYGMMGEMSPLMAGMYPMPNTNMAAAGYMLPVGQTLSGSVRPLSSTSVVFNIPPGALSNLTIAVDETGYGGTQITLNGGTNQNQVSANKDPMTLRSARLDNRAERLEARADRIDDHRLGNRRFNSFA